MSESSKCSLLKAEGRERNFILKTLSLQWRMPCLARYAKGCLKGHQETHSPGLPDHMPEKAIQIRLKEHLSHKITIP